VSSPGRRRIDEIGEESRRRILDAAEELFAERGFDRTSFVDISERSGISRGSIPWHFKNKHGLVMAVVERAIDREMPPERYQQSFPALTEVFDDATAVAGSGSVPLLFMIFAEAISGTGTLRTQCQEFLARRREGLERWLRAQRPETADPETAAKQERSLAAALHGALLGVHLQALVDPGNVDLGDALRSFAALVEGNLAAAWSTPSASNPH
jgi:TetR/AcrR family acrAB operon transcriptional repressor